MNDETPEVERFEAERRALLAALLDQVPFDGWTDTAMAAAAEQAGLDAEFPHRAFPRGGVDAIEYFNRVADEDMAAALAEEEIDAMRVRDRIARAVRLRLEQNAGHRDAVRRGLTVLSFPPNGPVGMRILYRTVDAIWRAAGDTATDFNFYTKRGLLAGVYSATVVYWLNDSSEDFSRTWRFLERRIDETMQIPKAAQRLKESLERLPDPLGLRNFLKHAQPGNFGR